MLTNAGTPRSSALAGGSSKWTRQWTPSSGSGGCWLGPRFIGAHSDPVAAAGQARSAGSEQAVVCGQATRGYFRFTRDGLQSRVAASAEIAERLRTWDGP